ncbi:NAD(P)/FAD-dependent oxidoreductase [Ensifer sp. ENS06]|nr:NAD(P)/FAD-dependent oxidoreductase [Ensifer sp. ENS06]
MAARRVDIVVVGAGPAGSTAARLLACRGRQVVLVDAGQPKRDRLEIVSPSATGIVRALQLEEVLADPFIARPCAGIRRTWGSQKQEIDDFLYRPGSQGYIVDRARFDARLRGLAFVAGASALNGRVVGVCRNQGGFEIEVRSVGATTNLVSSLLVDATGRSAALACRLGGERIVKERLVAERKLLDWSGAPSQEAAWLDVEAHGSSWTYATFGPDGRRESWTVYRDECRRMARGERFNASAACLRHAAGKDWIAIGDAAATFDPIASQGVVNALSSALVAVGAIAKEGGIEPEATADYSAAMRATFAYSELGRAEVYHALNC